MSMAEWPEEIPSKKVGRRSEMSSLKSSEEPQWIEPAGPYRMKHDKLIGPGEVGDKVTFIGLLNIAFAQGRLSSEAELKAMRKKWEIMRLWIWGLKDDEQPTRKYMLEKMTEMDKELGK